MNLKIVHKSKKTTSFREQFKNLRHKNPKEWKVHQFGKTSWIYGKKSTLKKVHNIWKKSMKFKNIEIEKSSWIWGKKYTRFGKNHEFEKNSWILKKIMNLKKFMYLKNYDFF